ncbi:MAG: hypothetical protein HQL90_11325 [Magnetococcales bacterium]|nr:hypothetical protein [Magnetococcales bacterium]
MIPQQSTKADKGKTILTLDLGTKTGWAIKNHGKIFSGTMEFKPTRFEGGGMRFVRFDAWLDGIKHNANPSLVYFEEVRSHGPGGTDAGHIYGGFSGLLTAWCERNKIPYQGVPVGTIKRFATGKGNAGKPEMVAAMTAKGHKPGDDNEADALAIMYWAMEQLKYAELK